MPRPWNAPPPRFKAALLDRDGVLVIPDVIDGKAYAPRRVRDLRVYADVWESVERLRDARVQIGVVTNQPDIGNAKISREEFGAIQRALVNDLHISSWSWFICEHRQIDDCDCRKPKPGLLLSAMERLNLEPSDCAMVGDRATDMEAGRAAGVGATIFIDRGYDRAPPPPSDHVVQSLRQAVAIILGEP